MHLRTWTRLAALNAFGAPIYVHWSVFVAVALLTLLAFNSPIYAALAIGCYISIIVIHELARISHRPSEWIAV